MVSSESKKERNVRYTQYEVDQRIEKLYTEYLDKKTAYEQATKDIFSQIDSSNSIIELGEFDPINYNEKYSLNTINLIEKAQRTGILQLSERGYTSVPEFVWTFAMTSFENNDMIRDKDSIIKRLHNKTSKVGGSSQTPLVYLDLSRNGIKKFVPKAPLEHLEFLKLDRCNLVSISEKVFLFRNLKILLLGNNELSELPRCLGYLNNLQELDVQCNSLSNLPSNLRNIPSLKKLNIIQNKLICISPCIVAIKNLEELKASRNSLLQLAEEIQYHNFLKTLDISCNQVTVLPDFCYMQNLQTFHANSNNLVIFPNFSGCKCLIDIQLNSNRIQEIAMENLQFVPVETLLLNDNKLHYVPDNINVLSSLVRLGLSNNLIKRLPPHLALIRTLNQVSIAGNSIENISEGTSSLISTKDLVDQLMKQYRQLMLVREMEKKELDDGEEKVLLIQQPLVSNNLDKKPNEAHKFKSRTISWGKTTKY